MAFLRRRTSIANSRSQNAADEPYKPRNHGVFKLIGALVPRVLNSIRDTGEDSVPSSVAARRRTSTANSRSAEGYRDRTRC